MNPEHGGLKSASATGSGVEAASLLTGFENTRPIGWTGAVLFTW